MKAFKFDSLTGALLRMKHDAETVADLEALITWEKSKAWNEGYEAFAIQFTQPMDEAGQRPRAANPYRTVAP